MNLKLTLEKAKEAYKNGTVENKKLLIDLYGREIFEEVKDRLKGYESACEIIKRKPLTIEDFKFLGEKQAVKQYARHRIQTGIEAINEGWEPDYENSNEPKYEIWQRGKQYGFSSSVHVSYTSTVGSDLVCQTREKAEQIKDVFKEELKTYLL